MMCTRKSDYTELRNPRRNTNVSVMLYMSMLVCTLYVCTRPSAGFEARIIIGGTAAAAPMPSDPALCGSCPLVTPYYCRLGDLLCFVFIVSLLYFFC